MPPGSKAWKGHTNDRWVRCVTAWKRRLIRYSKNSINSRLALSSLMCARLSRNLKMNEIIGVVLAVIAALAGMFFAGRKGGAEKERQRAEKHRRDPRIKADQVKESTDAKSDDDVADKLADKWVRGDDSR